MDSQSNSQLDTNATALNEFFAEVNALAIALKKSSAALHHEDDLPPGGRAVLGLLEEHGPLTVPQIARLYSSSRQNIQVVVNRLSEMSLLTLETNPAHKRSSLVRMTVEGMRLLERCAARETAGRANLFLEIRENQLLSATNTLKRARELLAGGPKSKVQAHGKQDAAPTHRIENSSSRPQGHPTPADAPEPNPQVEPAPEPAPVSAPQREPEPEQPEELPVSLL